MSGPATPDYRAGYSRGYLAGQRRRERETSIDHGRATSATVLFETLVSGLVIQGLSLDDILDAQLAGMKAKADQLSPPA